MHKYFEPPGITKFGHKREAYLNQWITRDIFTRLVNLTDNIAKGTIRLSQAKDHVFFQTCKQVLAMFRDLSERLSPITSFRKAKYPNTCAFIERNSPIFDIQVFGSNNFSWINACPTLVSDYIEEQRRLNTGHHQQQQQQRSSGGTSMSYSLAACYTASAYDLIKFIRNHDCHFYDKSKTIRTALGERPREYLDFFIRRFPALATQAFILLNEIRTKYATETGTMNLARHLKDIEYTIISSFTSDCVDGINVYGYTDDENDM